MILITNKDKFNSEDFEFLKDLFGDSKKKKRTKISNNNEFEEPYKKVSKKTELKTFQIQLKENLGTSLQDDMEELKSSNIESTRSQIHMNRKEKKKRGKKKKIKKKEVLLELKELLPIIQENNILLKNLIQCFRSMETSLKALTQEPIKIQIVK